MVLCCYSQMTAYCMRISDCSADVCSADLDGALLRTTGLGEGDLHRGLHGSAGYGLRAGRLWGSRPRRALSTATRAAIMRRSVHRREPGTGNGMRIIRYLSGQIVTAMVFIVVSMTCVLWLSQSLRFVDLIVNPGLPKDRKSVV